MGAANDAKTALSRQSQGAARRLRLRKHRLYQCAEAGVRARIRRARHAAEFVNKRVIIYDFDGPRDEDRAPLCLSLTLELLHEKINDPRHPFGHGYIVGALLADIPLTAYTDTNSRLC